MALVGFILMAVMAVACALAVVFQRNALYSALSLVGVFAATAGIYLLLQAPFLAVLQIMVYAGAIMVLFVFVIMLLSISYAESGEAEGVPPGWRRVLGLVLGSVVLIQLAFLGGTLVLSGATGDFVGPRLGSAESVGMTLYTRYIYAFEVASILLLVAIVGAVAITRRQGRGLGGHVGVEEES